jgi:mycofactocin precursor
VTASNTTSSPASTEVSEPIEAEASGAEATLVEASVLVEEISIDGMCGVY